VTAVIIVLSHDVEEKRFYVVVKSLRTKKELRKKAEILTVYRVLASINLEERKRSITIDFITWWMFRGTF